MFTVFLPALLVSLVTSTNVHSSDCTPGNGDVCNVEELGEMTLLQHDMKATRGDSSRQLAGYQSSPQLNHSKKEVTKDSCSVLTTYEHDGQLLHIEATNGNLSLLIDGVHLYKTARAPGRKLAVTIEDAVFEEPESAEDRASFDVAVSKLLADQRTPLILAASMTLATEGLTGSHAPCLVPLHILASTLAGKLGIRDPQQIMLAKKAADDHTCSQCRRRNPTINGEYGTKGCDNECYGMCGPDCTPWPICHLDLDSVDQPCFKGCEAHDYYCSCAGWAGWWECLTFDDNDVSPYCGDCVQVDVR